MSAIDNASNLGAYIQTQKGYAFKSNWYTTAGTPIIKVSDFTDDSVDPSDLTRIPDEIAVNYQRYVLHTGDVVIQTVGSYASNPKSVVGKVIRVPADVSEALLNQNAVKLIPNDELDNGFLFYLLRDRSFGKYIVGCARGAANQASITLEDIRGFPIALPSVPTQRRIASILSAYDDLIENNTRRIKILEQMAQAIYREWFVEFRVPGVKLRKATSEEQKMTGKDRFPVGWELKQLGGVIELAYGKALKADTRVSGKVPVYGSAGVTGYHNESLVTGPGIIVGRKGNVGSVFWSDEDFFPIDTAFYVVTELNLHYVYYNLREQNFINSDAAVPGLSRNQAYLNPFVVPASETLNAFGEFIDPLFGQIQNLTKKNANLRQTRDLLLPRLVGGEIDVAA